jgi:hypothetical protein
MLADSAARRRGNSVELLASSFVLFPLFHDV